MRSANLVRIAAEAELLRIRALLTRQVRRAVLGLVAVLFLLGVLVLAEVAGWQALRLYVAPIAATLILLGVDLLIAAAFGVLALRSAPSHAEQETLRIRRQALEAAGAALSITAAVPIAGMVLRLGRNRERSWLSAFRRSG
jgi:hypothetical protein